jgi:hypothetical protein
LKVTVLSGSFAVGGCFFPFDCGPDIPSGAQSAWVHFLSADEEGVEEDDDVDLPISCGVHALAEQLMHASATENNSICKTNKVRMSPWSNGTVILAG